MRVRNRVVSTAQLDRDLKLGVVLETCHASVFCDLGQWLSARLYQLKCWCILTWSTLACFLPGPHPTCARPSQCAGSSRSAYQAFVFGKSRCLPLPSWAILHLTTTPLCSVIYVTYMRPICCRPYVVAVFWSMSRDTAKNPHSLWYSVSL